MGRKEDRKAAKKEKIAAAEFCKVQNKYVPELFELFECRSGREEFVNGIEYKGHSVNVLRYKEKKEEKGEWKEREFQWITSLRITGRNAEKMAGTGRLRWKIENEGFNRQKNWQGDITHACSFNANALKNHYLIYQIADFVRQLHKGCG